MNRNIVCIGAGYFGGPTMAVIAKMNPDRKVVAVDINKDRIAAWNSKNYAFPICEPGLVDVVKEVRGKNLFFSTDIRKALQNTRRDLADLTSVDYFEDPYAATKDSDAILLMTDWWEYQKLDWARLYKSMRKPALVFDTRNCLDVGKLRKLGLKVLNVGK